MSAPLTREEVEHYFTRLADSTQYAAAPCHLYVQELAAHDAALRQQLEQRTAERDNLRLRIVAVDAEHADMERQKHKSIEAFQLLEQQLAEAQDRIARHEHSIPIMQDAANQLIAKVHQQLVEAQARVQALEKVLNEVIHAWSRSWDCSRDPGHARMNDAITHAEQALAPHTEDSHE